MRKNQGILRELRYANIEKIFTKIEKRITDDVDCEVRSRLGKCNPFNQIPRMLGTFGERILFLIKTDIRKY